MLETILAISGKPGLYRLVSRGNRSLIVETLDSNHRRIPTFANDKVISLADIAMYTDEEEVPLRQVLKNIQDKYEGKKVELDYKKASKVSTIRLRLPRETRRYKPGFPEIAKIVSNIILSYFTFLF